MNRARNALLERHQFIFYLGHLVAFDRNHDLHLFAKFRLAGEGTAS